MRCFAPKQFEQLRLVTDAPVMLLHNHAFLFVVPHEVPDLSPFWIGHSQPQVTFVDAVVVPPNEVCTVSHLFSNHGSVESCTLERRSCRPLIRESCEFTKRTVGTVTIVLSFPVARWMVVLWKVLPELGDYCHRVFNEVVDRDGVMSTCKVAGSRVKLTTGSVFLAV
jgi:hypothetical protein